VILFGSVARGEPARDVDVCLVLDPEKLTRIESATKGLEYIATFDLDIHLYHELPLYIQVRVLREGRIMLVKDEDRLYELAITTSQLFEDFQPRYMRYLEGVAYG
jgi:predicted nucleotidyltransferase